MNDRKEALAFLVCLVSGIVAGWLQWSSSLFSPLFPDDSLGSRITIAAMMGAMGMAVCLLAILLVTMTVRAVLTLLGLGLGSDEEDVLQTKAESYWTPASWEMPGDIDGSTWHRDHFESWAPQMWGKEKQGNLDEE